MFASEITYHGFNKFDPCQWREIASQDLKARLANTVLRQTLLSYCWTPSDVLHLSWRALLYLPINSSYPLIVSDRCFGITLSISLSLRKNRSSARLLFCNLGQLELEQVTLGACILLVLSFWRSTVTIQQGFRDNRLVYLSSAAFGLFAIRKDPSRGRHSIICFNLHFALFNQTGFHSNPWTMIR